MSKRGVLTHITPLPAYITREAAIELLHDHSLMITLNPLVTHHGRCEPPRHALPEEMESVWYEITDKIEYVPGTPLAGNVTYTACMHDMPTGLQTHIHAPAGLEIRGKWQILGTMPGEKREAVEIHTEQHGIPLEGLYLREDSDLRCNFMLTSIARKNLKKGHAGLIKRLLERTAHLAPRGPTGASVTVNSLPRIQTWQSETSTSMRSPDNSPSRDPAPKGGRRYDKELQKRTLHYQNNGYSVSVSSGRDGNEPMIPPSLDLHPAYRADRRHADKYQAYRAAGTGPSYHGRYPSQDSRHAGSPRSGSPVSLMEDDHPQSAYRTIPPPVEDLLSKPLPRTPNGLDQQEQDLVLPSYQEYQQRSAQEWQQYHQRQQAHELQQMELDRAQEKHYG
jgi:hypothetical protein